MNREKSWIYVINPKGIMVEVDEAKWPELSRKGYTLLGKDFSTTSPRSDIKEYLEVEEI